MRDLKTIGKEFHERKEQFVTEELFQELSNGYAGEKITKERANFLFYIKNKAIKIKNRNPFPDGFEKWFIDQISEYLLGEGESEGYIDDTEGKWLMGKVRNRDSLDNKLIEELKRQVETTGYEFPGYLEKPNKFQDKCEDILYSSRYVALIAVVGAIISSVILFFQGFGLIIRGLVGFFNDPEERYEILFERLVSSVDVFLFALVLIIFGVGVYELFIANVRIDTHPSNSRPAWLNIKSVDDLKSSLGKVILMVLIVSFFKHVLEISAQEWSPLALLYLALGILLIGLTLYFTHKTNQEENE